MKRFASVLLLCVLALIATPAEAQQLQLPGSVNAIARQGGTFYAASYATWASRIVSGNTSTGASVSITVTCPGTLADNTQLACQSLFNTGMLNPILVNDANAETVTPTAISFSTCPSGNIGLGTQNCATITGTFNNTHGAGAAPTVVSGSAGLGEAVSIAAASGGGNVVLDSAWSQMGGTNAMVTATQVQPSVTIEDVRSGAPQFWNPSGGATAIAVPTVLSAATAVPSATPVGAFGTGTYYMCIAYVDIMGQEGACSTTFSQAGLATGSFIFSPPAASTGAVGYTIYISLTSGTYQLAYKVPLVTQPSAVGAYPVANGVCTLTKVELTTPACAVANTSYAQVGATATVTAITVNTSPIDPQVTTVSTTSVYTPNAGGRTTYVYTPGGHFGTPGFPSNMSAFTIGAATGTTVPTVIGSVNIPPGLMNSVGKTLEVCGIAYGAGASTATIVNMQFQWDAFGQNTAGAGVKIGDLNMTLTGGLHYSFCEDFQTTVAAATATGGSILHAGGYLVGSAASQGATGAGTDILTAAVGSLNLAEDARINIIYLHVTGTDGAGLTLQGLTVKVLN